MSTLAQITAAIDDDIRNKTPLVLKVEHADVEQLIADEMFPDSVKIEWNGTSAVDPIADIVCNPDIPTIAKCTFKIYFTKHGNRVFYKGIIVNSEIFKPINNFTLATFETTLYQPLTEHRSNSLLMAINGVPTILSNGGIKMASNGIELMGLIPQGSNTYQFEGSYKVAN